jgi:hypothetical protein
MLSHSIVKVNIYGKKYTKNPPCLWMCPRRCDSASAQPVFCHSRSPNKRPPGGLHEPHPYSVSTAEQASGDTIYTGGGGGGGSQTPRETRIFIAQVFYFIHREHSTGNTIKEQVVSPIFFPNPPKNLKKRCQTPFGAPRVKPEGDEGERVRGGKKASDTAWGEGPGSLRA